MKMKPQVPIIILFHVPNTTPITRALQLGIYPGYNVHKQRDSAEWQAERCPVAGHKLIIIIH